MTGARCMACGAGVRRLGRRGTWDYGYCVECGAVQLMAPPTDRELERLYRDGYQVGGHYYADPNVLADERSRVIRQVADLVAAERPDGERGLVVELGAGWGGLGSELRRRGLPYRGIEPNRQMAEYARSRGLDVVTGELNRLAAGAFGAPVHTFVSMAVFEHLLHQEDVLRQQASLMLPHGAIVIQAPAAGIPRAVGRLLAAVRPSVELPELFGSLAPPWHVLLPTPASLRVQAARCGLRVTQVLASRAGRRRDWRRWLQIASEKVGQLGHRALGQRWPLTVAHIYVLRR